MGNVVEVWGKSKRRGEHSTTNRRVSGKSLALPRSTEKQKMFSSS